MPLSPAIYPVALAHEMARDVFGLEDPVVTGLIVSARESVFVSARFKALRRVDQGIRLIEGIKKNDAVSQ